MTILKRAIAEEHHLEEILADGYQPAALAIALAVIVLGIVAVVFVALGVTLAVYYWA